VSEAARVLGAIPQLRTTDLAASIRFVAAGRHCHLYLETADVVAAAGASKRQGVRLVQAVHETPWGSREFVITDDQGHTLYFGERR
jgi:uncharacterized glyoxalase superfamily protein PhnB